MLTAEYTIDLPLSGVDSEHCALIINKVLATVDGISDHAVELNNRKAVIRTRDEAAVLPKAVKAIRDRGYDVLTTKEQFPVLHMSCASCAVSAQTVLENSPGVVHVSVNYANAMAQVEYIPTLSSPAALQAAMQSIGYDLVIDHSEAATDALEALHRRQLAGLRKKTLLAIALSVPLVIIGMFFMQMPYASYIMWALATPVLLVSGQPFFVHAWKQLQHGSANMDTLVAMSTGVAYVFSVFNTVYPAFWQQRGLEAHVYFETAAVVIAFILLGKLLEEKAKGHTSSAIKKLMGLQPKTVTLVQEDGQEATVPVSRVQVGDQLLVKPGEKIAVDGTVQSGHSFVDESMISGEPVAVEKTGGTKVFAGTINQKGSFRFRADQVGGETLLAQIIRMVQEAQGSRAPVQKLVDKIAGIFVPVVILVAFLALAAWWILGGDNGFTQGLLAFVTVLVIACPCALGLATPTAIMAGMGKGAENGILIKDAESLELAKQVNAVVLDKTGTITEGRPSVTAIAWKDGDPRQDLADLIFSIEKQSEHPLAEAVVQYFTGKKVESLPLEYFESITGMGVKARYQGNDYWLGSPALLASLDIGVDPALEEASRPWLAQAQTVAWLANKGEALAAIAIADSIKERSVAAVNSLQEAGISVYMLTGDHEASAKAIAEQAGIAHYRAAVLPAEKAAFVQSLQQEGKVVAMAGDGINDSHALAQADVSIAMGKGSDIAMDVARMTIISSDLTRIPKAIRLSKYTVATIRQNLFWAFIYNIVGIPLAAGILYPFTGFLLNPMIAGAAMALSSVSVVSNSLRLKWLRL